MRVPTFEHRVRRGAFVSLVDVSGDGMTVPNT